MADEKGRATIARIMDFAGTRRPLTAVGCTLVAISMVLTMMPYVFIWLVVHDLIAVAPRWGEAASVVSYGWTAFGFAVAGIVAYFFGLMCTHLAAFRIESNMRKACAKRLMAAPLGYYDSHASGILRRRMDAATLNIEQLFAHNLADISGTVAMFVSLVILLFVFDWRMGLACFATVIISVVCIMQMMSGKGKKFMAEYQSALDRMSKASTQS